MRRIFHITLLFLVFFRLDAFGEVNMESSAFIQDGVAPIFARGGDLRLFFIGESKLKQLQDKHVSLFCSAYLAMGHEVIRDSREMKNEVGLGSSYYELDSGRPFRKVFEELATKTGYIDSRNRKTKIGGLQASHVTLIKKDRIFAGMYFDIDDEINRIIISPGDIVIISEPMP